MPFVDVKVLEGAFTRDQLQDIIRGVTDVFVGAGGEGIRQNVVVSVTETKSGLWGHGGTPLTIEMVEARRAGRARAGAS